MTREEAIERIKYHMIVNKINEPRAIYITKALEMAIEALEQEPKTIQERQAESEKYQKAFEDGYEQGYAQAKFDYEQEPCDDAISRQAVLDIIDSDWKYEGMEHYVNNLPSVNPQPICEEREKGECPYYAG